MPTLLSLLSTNVLRAAPALLGATLVRGPLRARIVEVEAYRTPDDPASHAHRGRTARNDIMFGPPGHAYIYFSYGVHWMLNLTAHEPGNAAAILIRAAEPLAGLEEMRIARGQQSPHALLSGPGKLCQAFGITPADRGDYLLADNPGPADLHIVPAEAPLKRSQIYAGPRIGISQAKDYPWRFIDLTRREWCSKPLPPLRSVATRKT